MIYLFALCIKEISLLQNMLKLNKAMSTRQMTIFVILRVAIGWHFLYEGITKVLNPNWSSIGYLMDSKGLGLFQL